jgi:hypothetical protein
MGNAPITHGEMHEAFASPARGVPAGDRAERAPAPFPRRREGAARALPDRRCTNVARGSSVS